MGIARFWRWFSVFVAVTLLLMPGIPSPASASNRASGPYAAYRPMERFDKTGEVTVLVLKGRTWKEAGRLSFDRFYRERRLDLSALIPAGEAARVRLVQKGGGAAHLDAALLGDAAPSDIRGAGNGLAKSKVARADFDVVDVSGKTVDLSFPAGGKGRVLSLVARVEGERRVGIPFLYPAANHGRPVDRVSSFYNYRPGTGPSLRNGVLDDRAKPFFSAWSDAASGHPSSRTYGWVGSDDKNLYVKIDFTGDDTRDGDADYTSVLVKGAKGIREFKVSEAQTRWGKPSFTYTDKVSWQHKVYDFAIPWKESGAAPGQPVRLAFSAYGTMAGYQPGVYETAAAYDPVNDRYLVVYARYGLTGAFDIYGQFVDATGAFIGSEFQITSDSGRERYPAVAFDPVNERYLVVNAAYSDGEFIQATLLDWDGGTIDSFTLSSTMGQLYSPSVAFNGRNNTYLVAWEDTRIDYSTWDIWGHIVDADGADVADDFRISTAGDNQRNASVAANSLDGTFLVVFDDSRSGTGTDIYGQLVLDDGSLVGMLDNVNLAVSNNNANQRLPKASFDPVTRRFFVAWQDERNAASTPDVYGQFLDNTGAAALPADTTVNLAVSTNAQSQDPPVLAHVPPAGAYLTAWYDNRGSATTTTYGQVVRGDGSLFGSAADVNVGLVPASDNAVLFQAPPGIAGSTAAPRALLSFAADPTVDPAVGARLGVRLIGAPPLPGGELQVVSTTPGNGATGVLPTGTISVTFNIPIDPSTVNTSGFHVERTSDSATVDGTFAFSAGDTVVTFTPSAPLDNNTDYTVTLPVDSIYDAGGTRYLETDYVFSFTTASPNNSVLLFFQDTPGIFGCAMSPGRPSGTDAAGALALILLPAAVLLLRKRWRGTGGRLFRGLFLLLAAAAMLLSSARVQAGALGPAQPSVAAGKFGAAVGYFYTEDKWEPDTASVVSGGTTVQWATDKVRQNSVFLRGAYGICPRGEVSVKVGAADRAAPQGFEGSYDFIAGVGAKGVLYGTPSFAVGPVLDFTWYANQEEDIAFSQGGTTWRGTEKIEGSWDLQVGLALQATVAKATVYAGPSFYWSRADVNYRITDTVTALDVENTYKQKNVIGGFAGAQAPLLDRLKVEVEGQYRSAFSVGATLLYAF